MNGIRQLAHKIETMVPDAQIAIGHGRMNEVALENVMLGFVNHDTNIRAEIGRASCRERV